MKRAVILHGTDGSPEENWFPWLKTKLEAKGYVVWVPALPGNHTPNREVYAKFLLDSGWDFTDNIVVGHSSGAVEALNMLGDERFPRLRLAMLVSAWGHGDPIDSDKSWLEEGQFANLFPLEGFDFPVVRSKADRIAFLHAKGDPYCPLEQAEYLAKQLNSDIKVLDVNNHLGSDYPEFPELWQIIEPIL